MANRSRPLASALLLLAGLALGAPECRADFIFTVTLDTSSLINHPAGPFSLEFQLNDGSGTNDGNNTALLSDFDFHGGMPVGAATLAGGASGDLGSNIVIGDNEFLNEFFQEFVPGNLLTFTVDLSTNVDPGPQPDQFSFAILDCNLVEIPTTGPADALLIADITGERPAIRTFAGDPGRVSGCANVAIGIPRPTIPEPATWALLACAGALAGWARRLRRPGPTA